MSDISRFSLTCVLIAHLDRIHGSGTPIGDALELEGLSLAMKQLGGGDKQFTVGSTKGNIGNSQVRTAL